MADETRTTIATRLRSLADNPPVDRRPYPIRELRQAADEIDRLHSALRGIACMDCYTREGEEPAHLLMMRLAKEALS